MKMTKRFGALLLIAVMLVSVLAGCGGKQRRSQQYEGGKTMKMTKRFGALLLIAVMLVSVLAGCGGKQEPAPTQAEPVQTQAPVTEAPAETEAAKEPVELTLWVTSRNADEFTAEREAAFEAEHPWIKLNPIVKEGDPGNEFYQAVAAGTAPDCILGSFTMMDKYISSGIVIPLNEYLDSWDETENLDKAYLEMFSRDGKYYGVPNQVMPMLFGYNKALFEAAGVAAPTTWDEALEAAKKLNSADGQVAGYATLAAEWTEWFFQYYVWQAGGDLTKENADGTIEAKKLNSADGQVAGYATLAAEWTEWFFQYYVWQAGGDLTKENADGTIELTFTDPAVIQVAGYATLAAEWTEWFFQYYVWQAGGDLTKENADGTIELTFTDPAVIEAAKYYQKLSAEGVLPSDRTLKFGDLLDNFARGKIAMMPFAVDWVIDVANKGMDLDDLGLILPPAGPSGKSATAIAGDCWVITAIAGDCWVINANTSKEKQDAAWEYISFMLSKNEKTLFYENLASKGAIAPVTIPRTDMVITDFAELPEEWAPVLSAVGEVGRLEFYGKADFGSYVDRAVQKILSDPNADPEKEFSAAQTLAEQEALAAFNEANKK